MFQMFLNLIGICNEETIKKGLNHKQIKYHTVNYNNKETKFR